MPHTLDLESFKKAWNTVIEANSILRTRIVQTASLGSLQVVVQQGITWKSSTSLQTYLEDDKKVSIVYGGPLIRLGLAEDSVNEMYFVWTAHHAVYDGYSLGVLFEQVREAYEHGTVPEGPSFNSFISYLQDRASDSSKSDSFWRAQFDDGELVSFPTLTSETYLPRPDHTERLSVNVSHRHDSNILPSSILRAAWALLMSRCADSDDVVFGTTLSGRNAPILRS